MSCNTNCNTTCNTNTTCTRGPCGPAGPAGPVGPAGPAGPSSTPNLKLITTDASHDYSAETTSFNIVLNSSTAIGTGGVRTIKLPEPTAALSGMVVKIIFARAAHTSNGVKIGFANSGSAVMVGGVTVVSTTADQTISVFTVLKQLILLMLMLSA